MFVLFDYIAKLALHQHLQGAFIAGNKIKSAIFYAGVHCIGAMNDHAVFQASAMIIYQYMLHPSSAAMLYRYPLPLYSTPMFYINNLPRYPTSIMHINIASL